MPLAIVVVGLVAAALAGCTRPPTIGGRWDLAFQSPEGSYPGWLELAERGDSLGGRIQGRFGHATPLAGIRTASREFRLLWPEEDDPGARPSELVGEVGEDGQLSGTLTDGAGRRTPFTGSPAPPLEPATEVTWGEPINLLASGLDGWRLRDSAGPNGWSVVDGDLVNVPPSGDLVSRQRFGDFRIHLEVNVPAGGNSGVYLRGRYEVQVLDTENRPPPSRGMGGIYGLVTPAGIPTWRAGEWQTFDITLLGRRVWVKLNDVPIIDDQEIPGITGGALDSDEAEPGPLMLQGDHSAIRYRNIVVTPAREHR